MSARGLIIACTFSMAWVCPALRAQTNEKDARPNADLERSSAYGYPAAAQDAWQLPAAAESDQRTAELWKKLCESRPADVSAQFNWYRSERNARMNANNGSLQESDKQVLRDIAGNIEASPAGAFEKKLTTYYQLFPAREAFSALNEAAQQNGDRQELLMPQAVQANMNGDESGLDRACSALEKRGGLNAGLQDIASDLLLGVARNGVVFCNGDMDTYPTLVRQRIHADRRDVLVVDQRLLADAGYRQRIWSAARAQGPVPAGGPPFARSLVTATDRPIYLALSLDRSWFALLGSDPPVVGLAFQLSTRPENEPSATWNAMKKNLSAGPLSRNYLLPGAVLLRQYKAQQDEAKAAALELELRKMAHALGAEKELYQAGVLAH